jgi:thiamine-phosphate pyrophosphorylase
MIKDSKFVLILDYKDGICYDKVFKKLPRNSGILFRNYSHPKREEIAKNLNKIAKKRSHYLIIANDIRLAKKSKSKFVHSPEYNSQSILKKINNKIMIRSCSAHCKRSLMNAIKLKYDYIFFSPLYKTSSHPDKNPIGLIRLLKTIQGKKSKIIALGGIRLNKIKSLKLTKHVAKYAATQYGG